MLSSIDRPRASPSSLRSSLSEADPLRGSAPGATPRLEEMPFTTTRPETTGVEPEDRAQKLGPPGADEPGDPQDLAAPDGQVGPHTGTGAPAWTAESSRTVSPGSCGTFGKISPRSRPTISADQVG